ncbi:MAG: protocatechuate 3,4-dioxygenase subunit beta, partial [Xanthobacteraceae bacterium]
MKVHPSRAFPGYKSTAKRHPKKPLVIMPHTLSELTGPVYGHDAIRP